MRPNNFIGDYFFKMYSFGDFKHELDYILTTENYCDIFCKRSLINGKLKSNNNVSEKKPFVIIKKNIKQTTIKYFGINNFENCCFLNSSLQVILNYPKFISSLKKYELRLNGNSEVIDKLLSYHHEVKSSTVEFEFNKNEDCIIYFGSNLEILNPCLELISLLGFTRNQHEDAEEFLTKLLTKIHEDLLKCEIICPLLNEYDNINEITEDSDWVEIGKGGKNLSPPREDGGEMSTETFLSDLISGKMIEKVSKRNRLSNSTVTPFFILPLNIQTDNITDVRSAIQSLTLPEKLSESHESRTEIGHLPTFLIVQLKRFNYLANVGIQKIQKKIDINSILRVPNDSISPSLRLPGAEVSYHLFGIVFHIGEGVMKGHYTAAVRDGDVWYYFDDSNVFLVRGQQSVEWLLNNPSAEMPTQLISVDLKTSAPRSSCVSGRRTPYLIFYTKI